MENNKGQSLIDIIFSMGVVVLVLTGVVILIVSTSKVKRITLERQKAVELSQILIEGEVKKTKDDPLAFWSLPKNDINDSADGYNYNIDYDCDISGSSDDNCNVVFTINWGDNQNLSVKRFFLRKGI
jgi:hypothetical protein